MLFVVISFSTYSPNTSYHIKYKNKNGEIVKFHVTTGVVTKLFLLVKKGLIYLKY
jgi:hypothetical protein